MELSIILEGLMENLTFKWPWGTGEWIIVGTAGVLLLVVIIAIIVVRHSKKKEKAPIKKAKVEPKDIRPMEPIVESKPKETKEEKPKGVIFDLSFDYEAGVSKPKEVVIEKDESKPVSSPEQVKEEIPLEEIPTPVDEIEEQVEEKAEEKEEETVEVIPESVGNEELVEEVEETPEEEKVVEPASKEEAPDLDALFTEIEETSKETPEEKNEEKPVEESLPESVEVVEDSKEVEPVRAEEKETKTEPKEKKVTNRYQGKYEIFQEGTSYRFHLRASNGEVLAISELYVSEKSARNGIETAKKNIVTGKFSIVEDKHGLWRFHLISSTGRPLLNSASYKTEQRTNSALESFKKFAVSNVVNIVEAKESQVEVDVEQYDDGGQFESSINGKYIIEEENGKFTYVLKASNGVKICKSQVYSSMVSCQNALEKFRETVYDGVFYISHDKNDKYQFKLYSNKPKRVVMVGEVYDAKDAAVKVIKSIKRFAKDGKLKDIKEAAKATSETKKTSTKKAE